MRKTKVERVFTLSSWEQVDGEYEYLVSGDPAKVPSLKGIRDYLTDMIVVFKGMRTGTKIKVTMEDIE